MASRASCALFLVALVLSSFCAAHVQGGSVAPLVGADVVAALAIITEPLTATIVVDLTKIPKGVGVGTVTLVKALGLGLKKVSAILEAGQVSELVVTDVKLVNGVLAVRLQLLGVDKVVLLDLAKLKATLVGEDLTVKLVLIVDEAKKVLHLQNVDGECISDSVFRVDINVDINI